MALELVVNVANLKYLKTAHLLTNNPLTVDRKETKFPYIVCYPAWLCM